MSEITAEDIKKSLLPKVDHLTYEHVRREPLVLKVARVCHGPDKKERPVRLDFEPHERCVDTEGKPLHYLPCKGMRVVLADIWGLNGRVDWVGKSLELFGNPDVMYGGEKRGGIQISKMSHIDKPTTVMVKVRRGTTAPFVVEPLKLPDALTPEDEAYIVELKAEIAGAESMKILEAIKFILKEKPAAVKDAVRSLYMQRQAELEPKS
jgi:hypothetical protein